MRVDLALLISVPIMIAFGQFLFKMAGKGLTGNIGRDLWNIAFNPYFIGAMALYGISSFLWVIAVQLARSLPATRCRAITYRIRAPACRCDGRSLPWICVWHCVQSVYNAGRRSVFPSISVTPWPK